MRRMTMNSWDPSRMREFGSSDHDQDWRLFDDDEDWRLFKNDHDEGWGL